MMMFRASLIVTLIVVTATSAAAASAQEGSLPQQQQQQSQQELQLQLRGSTTTSSSSAPSLVSPWEEQLTWEHAQHEQPSLLLQQEPASSSSSSSSSSQNADRDLRFQFESPDLKVINNCGTRISNFKAYYNVDFDSYSYQQTSASLEDGQSVTLSSVGSTDDTIVRFYAVDVVYDRTIRDFVLTEIPTKVTTKSTLFSGGVNFRLRSGKRVNYPIYATDVDGLSEFKLCGKQEQPPVDEDPINVPVGMPMAPTTTTTTTTSTTTTTTTTTTPQPPSTSESEALASCSKAKNKAWCQDWLKAHNSRRADFHASYDMTPSLLTWDNTLEAQAQAWADTFQDGNECTFGHDPNSPSGENLALNAGTGSYADARTAEDVLVAWWDEEYPLTQPPTNTLSGAGHFTQAAWYKSTKLGCGMITKEATFTSSSGRKIQGTCHVQVCRYGPGRGNCNLRFDDWENTVLTGRTC